MSRFAGVGDAVVVPAGTTIGARDSFTGRAADLSLSLLVRPDLSERWAVGLVVANSAPAGTAYEVVSPFVELRREGTQLVLSRGDARAEIGVAGAAGWHRLVIVGGETGIEARMAPVPTLGTGAELSLGPLPGDTLLPETRLLASGMLAIAHVGLDVAFHDPCGAPVPTIVSTDASMNQLGDSVAVARGDGQYCAVAARAGAPFGSYVSTDGVRWEPIGTGPARRDLVAVGLAWDGAAYRAVELTRSGALALSIADDCATWRPLPTTGAAARPTATTGAASVSYVVRGDGHTLFWTEQVGADHWLVAARSDDGVAFGDRGCRRPRSRSSGARHRRGHHCRRR